MVDRPQRELSTTPPLDYQSVVRTPRPGFGSTLDYEPKSRRLLARRVLRMWSVVLLTLPVLAAFFAWIYWVIRP